MSEAFPINWQPGKTGIFYKNKKPAELPTSTGYKFKQMCAKIENNRQNGKQITIRELRGFVKLVKNIQAFSNAYFGDAKVELTIAGIPQAQLKAIKNLKPKGDRYPGDHCVVHIEAPGYALVIQDDSLPF